LSTFWQTIGDSFSPLQKTILKVCAVIGTLCLIILGIDAFIVQPRQSAEMEPFTADSVEVKVRAPKLDLGLDEQLRRSRAELDALRLEREHQARLRRQQSESAQRDDPH
jgi:hypothetical protein